jgi:RNA polymerase sigma-70 factor, ECF subfamily
VSNAEEHELIRQARDGDRRAFGVLVDAYWGPIYRWLHGLTRDGHGAEDLTQEVLVKAWTKLASFQPGTHFRAWLFRIAGNHYLDSRRSRRAVRPQQLPDALQSGDPDPVATLLGRETLTRLEAALAEIPESFRGAFLLRTQEQLSFQEIAEILGLTEETARWRVFKARRLLLEKLGPALDGAKE